MTRDERLQQIIAILRDGKMHRARDLAARLDVSERTIWRDMAEISAYGVPVEGERGVGYILRRAMGLPPLVLTKEELSALEHLLTLAEAVEDPRLAAGAASLAAKIRAALPSPPAEDAPKDAGEGLAGAEGSR
ncbi:helix-turn-helix transcriptional regulator [Thioclava pacifica]|uniref:HTH deoR-type domain-containing protein n=1 Tax=Thioclava pacifica DSM 10166 TaxID=1353537 RepID=A0A074JL26_9RHOB|nr:HTH domain-containing protein [Thioclava pacifica]KEO56308.1 hypothetical protein TP2_01925 [Thioclava pacifica DSM 10166]